MVNKFKKKKDKRHVSYNSPIVNFQCGSYRYAPRSTTHNWVLYRDIKKGPRQGMKKIGLFIKKKSCIREMKHEMKKFTK